MVINPSYFDHDMDLGGYLSFVKVSNRVHVYAYYI
jgi:hypothetical protein